MYIIIFMSNYKGSHIAVDSYGLMETFHSYEAAVEEAEKACAADTKREWYFNYKIFELATS